MKHLSTLKGFEDILPDDWPLWTFVSQQVEEVARLFGYRRIETPTLADAQLFLRTSGAGSDVVRKEMYTFQDRDGDDVALRPEGTAPVMRAYLQHGMQSWPQPVKLFYIERMFRHENTQRGRLREHHQFGCEAIGVEGAHVDVEMIALLDCLYRRLGFRHLSLHLNSIGDASCRPRYLLDLEQYLRKHVDGLANQDRERLERSPLRVLDSKEGATRPILEGAPRMVDYLCDACAEHWETLRRGLDALGIGYVVDPRLVRGLDYYTRTVFEFIPGDGGAQSTVGAGGRYDALSEVMGGPPIPGVGFGSGVERIILEMKTVGADVPTPRGPAVYVVHRGDQAEDVALVLAQKLREAGVPTEVAWSGSLKSQMRRANSSGATFAAILGEDELSRGQVSLRNLSDGKQVTVERDDLVKQILTVIE